MHQTQSPVSLSVTFSTQYQLIHIIIWLQREKAVSLIFPMWMWISETGKHSLIWSVAFTHVSSVAGSALSPTALLMWSCSSWDLIACPHLSLWHVLSVHVLCLPECQRLSHLALTRLSGMPWSPAPTAWLDVMYSWSKWVCMCVWEKGNIRG